MGDNEDVHIAESNHADCLPDTETNSRRDAAVKTLDAVVRVDVLRCGSHVQVLGAIGVNGLGLELNADNLDWLVPRAQSTTKSRSSDLLDNTQLLAALLSSNLPDTGFSNTGQTEAGTPVCNLTHGNGIYTAVDTTKTLGAPYAHERLHGRRGFATGSCDLVFCDLDSFHAGAETHGSIGLCQSTRHTATDTSHEIRRAERLGVVFSFRCNEEENGALGGSFDPGPRNETLVDCSRPSQHAPSTKAMYSNLQPATPPRPQIRVMAPDMPSDLLAAMVVFTTSKGYLRRCQLSVLTIADVIIIIIPVPESLLRTN